MLKILTHIPIKKVVDLFVSLTIILYLWDVERNIVYDGEPVVLTNDYEPNFKSSLFVSGFFYTHEALFDLKLFKSKSKPFNAICG